MMKIFIKKNILNNIKSSFKDRETIEANFKVNEKCQLNKKFKIKKLSDKKKLGILISEKIKK